MGSGREARHRDVVSEIGTSITAAGLDATVLLLGGSGSAAGEAVSVGGFDDEAGSGHLGETFVERGVADAAGCTQLGEWPRFGGSGERCGDALIDGSRLGGVLGLRIGLDRPQGEGVIALGEFESDAGDGGGGAVLDGQDDAVVTVAAEVEVGIAPGMEFGRSAQGLTGADRTGALSGVVDDGHGDGVTPLQFAQEGEQWGDLTADILVDAMQPDEGIEHEQAWLQPCDSLLEACAVSIQIEAQTGRGDYLDVEFRQRGAGGGTDALEAAANDVQGILGRIEQNAAGTCDREAAQAGRCRGDGDGQIEGEEGFAALGLAADDPHRLLGPQLIDQPTPLLGNLGETPGRLNRKLGHRRRRLAALASWAAGMAQISKNNVSSM